MELSVVYSRALQGIEAPLVEVETHLSNGLPAFNIVGLPETAVREAKDRVRSAILNSHFSFPDRRITVNLAPADLPKSGGRFDLAIALGILSASGQVPPERLSKHEFLGELALDGSLRPVSGAISAAVAAAKARRTLVLAAAGAEQAALVPGSIVKPACDVLTVCAHLRGAVDLPQAAACTTEPATGGPDLKDLVGQAGARRALEIAAAGGHNLLFWGPPGTGKTLLASCLPGILPPPSASDVLTGLALRDAAGLATAEGDSARPFRSPHHSASAAALIGGGSKPRPGEISLAHGGVLFLDELPEFNRSCLEALREPLESGAISLSRAGQKITYPAAFQLLAAMNPCPCGHLGDPDKSCRCTPDQVHRYLARISGPLLDRIDIHVPVNRIPAADLLKPGHQGEHSATVQERVRRCRARQQQRQSRPNSRLGSEQLASACLLGDVERKALEDAANRLHLSGRAVHRSLRLARTIADLADAENISGEHLHEALAYRNNLAQPST